MKKIIAFLSALVMTVAMSATVSFAADNEVVYNTTVDGSTVTIDVSVNTTYDDLKTIGIFFNMEDAIAKGGTVTVANGDATFKYVAPQKMVSAAFAPTDAHKYVSGTVLGTITVTGATDNFNITMVPTSTRTATKFSSVASGEVTSEFTDSIATTIVVKAAPVIERGSETFVATATDADGYTGVKFNFTTNYKEAPSQTGSATVAFGTALENGSAVVALTVNDIIKTVDGAAVAFDCTGVELY